MAMTQTVFRTRPASYRVRTAEARRTQRAEMPLFQAFLRLPLLETTEGLCIKDGTTIDPCSGSGHILAYMFDMLIEIYEDYGISTRDAVKSIIDNNIWGLDIDKRASQLAYFSVMMKARQYDRRFFSIKDEEGNLSVPQPHIMSIHESNGISNDLIDYFCGDNKTLRDSITLLINDFNDAGEYGSILKISNVDFEVLYKRVEQIRHDISIYKEAVIKHLIPIIDEAYSLSQNYHVVVTNPPYMSNRGMSKKLSSYIKDEYPDCKNDMFAVFIDVANRLLQRNGLYGMITQPSIITLAAFKNLRKRILLEQNIMSILHMGRGIFGIDFGSAAFVIRKERE